MNSNSQVLYNQYQQLYNKLKQQQFVIDKTGRKLVQILGQYFVLNPEEGHHIKVENEQTGYVFRQTNEEYVERETAWHQAMQLNIEMVNDVKIWQYCSGDNGQINSNYGWCVYHPDNGSDGKNQFQHALQALKQQKQTRRAMIIYTRPTMHSDFRQNGKNDFLCTTWNQFFIRDNELHMFYVMRSNDAYFGTINNIPWAMYVYRDMYNKLLETYPDLCMGVIHWQSTSWHLYQGQFAKLRKLFENSTPKRVVEV